MILPKGFQFSQGSLQDFVDCRRRFYLRYVQQLSWPAVESEPMLENEHFARQGKFFHKIIQQHLIGVSAERIARMNAVNELENWWQNYLDFYHQQNLAEQPALFPEITLSTALGDHRLIAAYDLICHQKDDTLVIYDWKTNRNRPSRTRLKQRLQTRVYSYLLVKAGDFINGGKPVQAEQIHMVYWFAGFPSQPESFFYDTQTFNADHEFLEYWAVFIEHAAEVDFDLTKDEQFCKFCVYRSLCRRGIQAGIADPDNAMDSDNIPYDNDDRFDIDQIAEIAF